MAVTWRRAASSGTTPPWHSWTSNWEDTIEERTLRPPDTTAADVSSHDVSMPRTITTTTWLAEKAAGSSGRPSAAGRARERRHAFRPQAISKTKRECVAAGFNLGAVSRFAEGRRPHD